jgi:hypothetical protein
LPEFFYSLFVSAHGPFLDLIASIFGYFGVSFPNVFDPISDYFFDIFLDFAAATTEPHFLHGCPSNVSAEIFGW